MLARCRELGLAFNGVKSWASKEVAITKGVSKTPREAGLPALCYGRLAQLVARRPYKAKVIGSSPIPTTTFY